MHLKRTDIVSRYYDINGARVRSLTFKLNGETRDLKGALMLVTVSVAAVAVDGRRVTAEFSENCIHSSYRSCSLIQDGTLCCIFSVNSVCFGGCDCCDARRCCP